MLDHLQSTTVSHTLIGEALNPIWQLTISMFPPVHGGKLASAFGSYGWSGEAAKLIREFLEESKFAIVNDGIRVNWAPDQETIEQLREYGRKFVEEIAE